MSKNVALLVITFFLPCAASAQDTVLPLRLKKTVAGGEQTPGVFTLPVKCDGKGNLYLRGYPSSQPLGSPVDRVSPEGQRTARFDPQEVPEFNQGMAYDFAVNHRGEVYMLGLNAKGDALLAKFSADGKHDSTTPLESLFVPAHFAVLASGEVLATGFLLSEEERKPTGETFTALFDRSGKLIKRLDLAGDVRPEKEEDEKKGAELRAAVSLGTATSSEDGYLYVLRATSTALIFKIGPDGSVAQTMEFVPPENGFRPITMKVAGGRIVVHFEENEHKGRPPRHFYTVADAYSGDTLFHYTSTPETSGVFACYAPDGLTFLATRQGQLILKRAGG